MSGSARNYLSKKGILVIPNIGPRIQPSNFLVNSVPVIPTATIIVAQDNRNSPDFVRTS